MIKLIFQSLGSMRPLALLVLGLMLICATLESLGLALILPILDIALETNATHQGLLSKLLAPLSAALPTDSRLPWLLVILVGMTLTKAFAKTFLTYSQARLTGQVLKVWIDKLLSKRMMAPYADSVFLRHGETVNNILNEPSRAAQAISDMMDLLAKLILTTGILSVMFLASFWVTAACLATFVFIGWGIHAISRKHAHDIGKKRIELNQSLYATVSESLSGLRQLKTFDQEDRPIQTARKLLARNLRLNIKGELINKTPIPLGETILVLCIAVGLSYLNSQPGGLAAVFPVLAIFVVAARPLMSQVSQIVSQRLSITTNLPSLRLVIEQASTDALQPKTKGILLKDLKTAVRFEHVSFSYKGKKPLFTDLTLEFPLEKTTAIVGPSGAGKSTVLDLLLGLYHPDGGHIVINEHDIATYNLESWRKHLGFVSQDSFLFNMTVRENVLIGHPEATGDEVVNACKQAHAHSFITALPEGYETILGDRGVSLSGGQKQRIAIARAIIRNPDVLIFDEATSALDSQSEASIQSTLDDLGKRKTVIIVAHRLHTIRNADRIYKILPDGSAKIVLYDELNTPTEN